MKPVGDGNDMCPFDGEVKKLFDRILEHKGCPLEGDTFKYNEFAKIMAETMDMQCGKDKAPLHFQSDLLQCNFD